MKMIRMLLSVFAVAIGLVTIPQLHAAETAKVTVIHGISGLPKAVDVYANGAYLFSFDYKGVVGPVELAPDTYNLEVKLDGTTVLSTSAFVEAGKNYTVLAHFKYVADGTPGIALSVFENDATGTGPGQTRLTVRHAADAPAVDVDLLRGGGRSLLLGVEDLANAQGEPVGQAGPVLIRPGAYRAELYAAGTNVKAFDSGRLALRPNTAYIVYAIGSLTGGTFDLLVQTINTGK